MERNHTCIYAEVISAKMLVLKLVMVLILFSLIPSPILSSFLHVEPFPLDRSLSFEISRLIIDPQFSQSTTKPRYLVLKLENHKSKVEYHESEIENRRSKYKHHKSEAEKLLSGMKYSATIHNDLHFSSVATKLIER